MGTRRTFSRERSRGKGVESTSNVAPTPATDLLDVDPDARHQREFIVAILEKGYQNTSNGSALTYHWGFQAGGVHDGDEDGI